MRTINVDRMRRHTARTTPDTLRVHQWDEDYWAIVRDWQDRMSVKHGEQTTGHADLDPATGWVTFTVIKAAS